MELSVQLEHLGNGVSVPPMISGSLDSVLDHVLNPSMACISAGKTLRCLIVRVTSAISKASNLVYAKANEGIIFPLKEGIFFAQSPMLFIPVEELAGMETSSGGARSFNFEITTTSDVCHEFSMIDKAEERGLGEYMRWVERRLKKITASKEQADRGTKEVSAGNAAGDGTDDNGVRGSDADEADQDADSDDYDEGADSDFDAGEYQMTAAAAA